MTLLSIFEELPFLFLQKVFFFFLISPSLRGGLGSREDWRKIKLCGPKRKNTFSFPSRGILRSLLALLHTLLSEWASTFEAFTKSHPLDGCSQHRLVTSTDPGLPPQQLPSDLLTSTVSKTPLKGGERAAPLFSWCPPLPRNIISPLLSPYRSDTPHLDRPGHNISPSPG